MPGPPPDPNARRRNPRVGLLQLPAGGRPGTAPKWPLLDDPATTATINSAQAIIDELEELSEERKLNRAESARLTRAYERIEVAKETRKETRRHELAYWRDLWKTPQAVAWERMTPLREVAQYVRHQIAGELGDLNASRQAESRAHKLGLTPKGLRDNMWVITEDEVGERRGAAAPAAATGTDGGPAPKRRLKAVDPGQS